MMAENLKYREKDELFVFKWIPFLTKRFNKHMIIDKTNPYSVNRNKMRLLFSSAKMFKKPLWQTV